ncbi:hypothetical protein, partial [Xanthomonas arboricola]
MGLRRWAITTWWRTA